MRANLSGKAFEQLTDCAPILLRCGFRKQCCAGMTLVKDFESPTRRVSFTRQASFTQHFDKTIRHPDEAFIIEYLNGPTYVKIIEKKHQLTNGSMETKLWAAPALKREYELILGSEVMVDYALCLNTFLYDRIHIDPTIKYKILAQLLREANIPVFCGNDAYYFSKVLRWTLYEN